MSALDDIKARLGYIPTSQWQMEHELGNAGTNVEKQQEEVKPLEVKDVPNKPFPETRAQEPAKVRMQFGKPQPVKPAEEKAGTDGQKQLTYEQMFEMTNPYGDLQKKKEDLERKRKRDATFAAIGDGLNAFHQAYAYSRGIKPLTENKSQSKAVRDRYDKLFEDYSAKELAYLRDKMNARNLDQRQQNWLDEMQFKKEQAQKALDYKVKKDEEAKEDRKAKEKQAQDNWQAKFDAEQKDKEERRNNLKEHYERQDRNAANRNANSGKSKGGNNSNSGNGIHSISNTPPSRRKSNNNSNDSNTPPSRQRK